MGEQTTLPRLVEGDEIVTAERPIRYEGEEGRWVMYYKPEAAGAGQEVLRYELKLPHWSLDTDLWCGVLVTVSRYQDKDFVLRVETARPIGFREGGLHLTRFPTFEAARDAARRWLPRALAAVQVTRGVEPFVTCESHRHPPSMCWGELRECPTCGLVCCYEDGGDEPRGICDGCWAEEEGVSP